MGVQVKQNRLKWLVLVAVLLPVGAISGGWADFAGMFPLYPCQDGWLGCVSEDGELRSPQLQWDEQGRPLPSDMRVDWDGNPTQTFSPFVGISDFSDAEEIEAVNEPSSEPIEEPAAVEEEPENVVSSANVEDAETVVAVRQEVVESRPVAQKNEASAKGGNDRGPAKQAQTARERQQAKPPVEAVAVNEVPEKKIREAPVEDVGCDDLKGLEMAAMVGGFSNGQIRCLNDKLARSSKQTEKIVISKLLMNDVYSKGDHSKFMQLLSSHLQNIDKSDPELVYKYVAQLQKKGTSRAKGVVRWAGVALENKTRWSGATYKKRVNKLLTWKTVARSQLFKKAADETIAKGTPEAAAQEESAKNSFKTAAREWYEYTKHANLDGSRALQACIAAAGFESYCTGR